MSKFPIVLYGSNTKPSATIAGFPLIASVTALSDVKSYTFDALGLFPVIEVDTEKVEYVDGYKKGNKTVTLKFGLQDKGIYFPTTKTNLDTFYPKEVLEKEYNWVTFPASYFLCPTEIYTAPTSYCAEVVVTAINTTVNSNIKQLTLDMELAT